MAEQGRPNGNGFQGFNFALPGMGGGAKSDSELAMALNYTHEIKNLFAVPKYSTMEELTQIRKNSNKKKAHRKP